MRIPILRLRGTHRDLPDCQVSAPPDSGSVWNALASNSIHLLNHNLLTHNLSESRTSETINLCATASARRLCGN